MLPLNISCSWGLIIFKRFSERWDYIINTGLLTMDDAHTFCREMGYTHAVVNSLQTVESHYKDRQFDVEYL